MFFKATRHRTPTRCRQWRGSVTCRAPGGRRSGGGGAPGRRRSASEARIVARGAAVRGRGWGWAGRGGCAAEVPNLGRRKGGCPGGRAAPLPTPRGPPVFSEAAVCRTPRLAGRDAPKRPMVDYPCRPAASVRKSPTSVKGTSAATLRTEVENFHFVFPSTQPDYPFRRAFTSLFSV